MLPELRNKAILGFPQAAGNQDEEASLYRRADCISFKVIRIGHAAQTWSRGANDLALAAAFWEYGGIRCSRAEAVTRGEYRVEVAGDRTGFGS